MFWIGLMKCGVMEYIYIYIYIYISVHLYSAFRTEPQCQFSNVTSQLFFHQATFLHTVSFLIEGSHPLPDQLPGEHTCPPSHTRQCLFIVQPVWMWHSLTHSHVVDRSMVVGHVPMDHMFFYVYQSHRHGSTQPSLFTSWVVLCELLYAHMT